jgi:hypothetical protein
VGGTGGEGRVQTDGGRIDTPQGVTSGTKLVIDLDILDLRELLEIGGQGLSDAVDHTSGLATSGQIQPGDTFGELQLAVAGEAVRDQGQAALSFSVGRAFEELIQDSLDGIYRGRDRTLDGCFIRELSAQETVVVGEEDGLLDERGRVGDRWRTRWSDSLAGGEGS